jgi:hypothetical protein
LFAGNVEVLYYNLGGTFLDFEIHHVLYMLNFKRGNNVSPGLSTKVTNKKSCEKFYFETRVNFISKIKMANDDVEIDRDK